MKKSISRVPSKAALFWGGGTVSRARRAMWKPEQKFAFWVNDLAG